MIRIAALTYDPLIGELAGNRRLATEAVQAAVAKGAELVVLPELITSGYVFSGREEAASVAIGVDDEPIAELCAESAAGAVIVAGFAEVDRVGRLFNSAVVLDRGSVLAVYRKAHLWDREKLIFEPGDEPPPVLDTSAGRIGVLVCYDLEFPEMTRSLALRGADLIAVPTNWPLVSRPDGEHPPEVIQAMAAARTNRVFIVCADRCGTERGVAFTGGTCIIDPDGWMMAHRATPGEAVAVADLGRARSKAIGPRNDVLDDRRPSLYGVGAALHEEKPIA